MALPFRIAFDGPRMVAVLDACVLYSMPTADLLLRLAEKGFFEPRWSSTILAELLRVFEKRGYDRAKAELRIRAMSRTFEDAMVEDFEAFIPAMTNDPNDRHVVAAAVKCQASLIVTENVRHFAPVRLAPFNLVAMKPASLLIELIEEDPAGVMDTIREQAAATGCGMNSLLNTLARQVPSFVRRVGELRGVARGSEEAPDDRGLSSD